MTAAESRENAEDRTRLRRMLECLVGIHFTEGNAIEVSSGTRSSPPCSIDPPARNAAWTS
jgi:hypothetical protein